ncbi:ThuA domain-containing protein [uncultured Microbacterium sp.]|uniref:ThuA domain-containing protein n=1 Tax=uncultured Microbacterium sp. TaxID=191216 RepID=UPI0035CA3BF2
MPELTTVRHAPAQRRRVPDGERADLRIVVATGSGRYADPWHPFEATSELVASILSDDGAEVSVNTDVDDALQRLEGIDVLVVNAGDPWRHDSHPAPVPPESVAGLDAALARGIGIVSLHSAVSSLRDYAAWAPAIGAVWVPTVSMHPPFGETRIRVLEHEATEGMADFEVSDERYCFLQSLGESQVVAEHRHDDRAFPTAWTRRHGRSRVSCSLLGHDERSYESAGHRELLKRLTRWSGRGHHRSE